MDADALSRCQSLTALRLDNCKSLPDNACRGMTGLVRIELPRCQYIGSEAFSQCTSLTSISLPCCKSVGRKAFNDCSGLLEIDLPRVEIVLDECFKGCSGVSSINLPLCHLIPDHLFDDCIALVSLNLNSVERIGNYMFCHQTRLTELHLDKCEYIGHRAFDTLISNIDTEVIGCPLQHLHLPAVRVIDKWGCYQMWTLQSVYAPNVVVLDDGAFDNCRNLTRVDCPACKFIGEYCFRSCRNLSYIDLHSCEMISYEALTHTQVHLDISRLQHKMFIHYTNIWHYPICLEQVIELLRGDDPTMIHRLASAFPSDSDEGRALRLWFELTGAGRQQMIDEFEIVARSSASPVVPNKLVARYDTWFFGVRYVSCGYKLSNLTLHITGTQDITQYRPKLPVVLMSFPNLTNVVGTAQDMMQDQGYDKIEYLNIPRCHVQDKAGFEDRCWDKEWYDQRKAQLLPSPNPTVSDYLYTFSETIRFIMENSRTVNGHTPEEQFEEFSFIDYYKLNPWRDSHGRLINPYVLSISIDNEVAMIIELTDQVLSGNIDEAHRQLLDHIVWGMRLKDMLTILLKTTHRSVLFKLTPDERRGFRYILNNLGGNK